jgi:hypothetical protein
MVSINVLPHIGLYIHVEELTYLYLLNTALLEDMFDDLVLILGAKLSS